jgi:hypothetical protein
MFLYYLLLPPDKQISLPPLKTLSKACSIHVMEHSNYFPACADTAQNQTKLGGSPLYTFQ